MGLDLEPIARGPVTPGAPPLDVEIIVPALDERSTTNALPVGNSLAAGNQGELPPGWWEQNVVNPTVRGYQQSKANLGNFLAAERADWVNRMTEGEYQRRFGRPVDLGQAPDFPLDPGKARATIDRLVAGELQPRPIPTNPSLWASTPLEERLARVPGFSQPAEMAMRAQDVAAAIPSSPALQEWQQADGGWATLQALLHNPVSLPVNLMAESAAPSAVALSLGALGSTLGPAGTAAGVGAGSFSVEAISRYTEAIQAANGGRMPATPEDLAKLLADHPQIYALARDKAARKGLGVAAFDALSAGLAGRFVAASRGLRPAVTAAAKEVGLQAVTGMTGEAAGETWADDPLNLRDILAEGIAEIPGGIGEGAVNWRHQPGPVAETTPTGGRGAPSAINLPPVAQPNVAISPESDFIYPPAPAEPQISQPAPPPAGVREQRPTGRPATGTPVQLPAEADLRLEAPIIPLPSSGRSLSTAVEVPAQTPAPPPGLRDIRSESTPPIGAPVQLPADADLVRPPPPALPAPVEIAVPRLLPEEGPAQTPPSAPSLPEPRPLFNPVLGTAVELPTAAQIAPPVPSPTVGEVSVPQLDLTPLLDLQAIAPELATTAAPEVAVDVRIPGRPPGVDLPGSLREPEVNPIPGAPGTGTAMPLMRPDLRQAAADPGLPMVPNDSGTTAPETAPSRRWDEAIRAIEEVQNALRGKAFADPFGLTAALDMGLTVARAALRAGQSIEGAIRQAVAAMRQQHPSLTVSDADLSDRLAAAISPDDLPIRQRAEKLLARADLPEATRQAVEAVKGYDRINTAEQEAVAREIIRGIGGPENVVAHWDQLRGEMSPVLQVPLWSQTLDQLIGLELAARRAGDTQVADRYGDAAAQWAAARVPETTTQAQALRMLGAIGQQTPAGWEFYAHRLVAKAREITGRDVAPTARVVADQFRAINQAGVEALPGDEQIQVGARQTVDETIHQSPATRTAIEDEVADSFGPTVGPIVRRTMRGETPNTLAIQLEFELGLSAMEAEGMAKQLREQWTLRLAALRKSLPQRIAAARRNPSPPNTAGALDRAIAAELSRLKLNLGQLVRQHFTVARQAGETLAQSLTARLGVPPELAQQFGRLVEDRFAAMVQTKKAAVLNQLTGKAKALRKKSAAERLIEFSNLGGFDDAAWNEQVMSALRLPQLSREARTEIRRRATALQALPPDSLQRQTAQRELTDFIARSIGVNPWDLGWSVWYAHILSGPETHARNLIGNVMSLTGSLAAATHGNPLALPRLLAGAFRGAGIGWREAKEIMRAGTGANLHKFTESGSLLENIQPGQFVGSGYLRALRYVGRALSAGDALAFFPAQEAKAAMLAHTLARKSGARGKGLEIQVRQLLGQVDAQGRDRQAQRTAQLAREAADMQAVGIIPAAAWYARREQQLIDAARPEELRSAARDFALRATYNNQPYGLLGVVAGMINSATRYAEQAARKQPGAKIPALAAVAMRRIAIPFTTISANVINEQINYTPWAFARLALAYMPGPGRGTVNGEPITRDLALDLASKGALGTLLLGSLAAAAAANLADDDGENFQVFGGGPVDKSKRDALRQAGWIPYSVRVKGQYFAFRDSPAALGLSVLGNYLDASRWSGPFRQADMLNRVAYSLRLIAPAMVQQSFLDGLATLVDAVDQPGSPRKAGDRAIGVLGRGVASAAVPNILRQIDRWMDPTKVDQTTITGGLLASVPFARRALAPALNALGEPITPDRLAAFTSSARENLWRDLARRGIYPSPPEQGEMTADEYYQLVQLRGQLLRPRLAKAMPRLESVTAARAQAIATQMGRAATVEARAKLGRHTLPRSKFQSHPHSSLAGPDNDLGIPTFGPFVD